jgi:hypothetical protein
LSSPLRGLSASNPSHGFGSRFAPEPRSSELREFNGELRGKAEIGFVAVAAVGSTLRQIDATVGFPERPAIARMLQPKAMRIRVAERAA